MPAETTPTDPLLLSIDDTGKLLGVPRRTLYSMMASGKLPPSFKLGGKRVFRRADIEQWVRLGMPCLGRFLVLTGPGARR
jgi:excisionase family DNA binding protein